MELTTLGLVDGHGIGQGNLVPFIAWIGDLATVEVDGNLVLLGVGIFGRQEVGDVAQVAIEDIGLGIVDQMDDSVALTKGLLVVEELQLSVF